MVENGVRDLLEFSRELAALAQAGLTYTKDPFDKERFLRLREMAGELLRLPEYSPDFRWPDEIGYATPKVDVRAVVFRGSSVLMIRETSSGLWTVPGGWADVNFSPAENVERECLEETGYVVKARVISSIVDRDRAGYPANAHSIYKIYILCDLVGGEATTGIESSEVGFVELSDLPPLDTHRTSEAGLLAAWEHQLDPMRPSRFN